MKFAGVPLAIFSIVLVVPFVNGVYYTFTDWDGFETTKLVGFSNYTKSFQDPTFWSTLRFTALFVVVSLILVNAVAFGLALIVTSQLRSKNFLRTFFFVPNLVGGVVLGGDPADLHEHEIATVPRLAAGGRSLLGRPR